MSEIRRIQELEIAVTALRSAHDAHEKYCDARWRVMWKLVTLLSGGIALVVALVVEMLWRP